MREAVPGHGGIHDEICVVKNQLATHFHAQFATVLFEFPDIDTAARHTQVDATGRADLYPACTPKRAGYKAEIDATDWLISEVTHELNRRGYITQIQLETATSR